MNLFARLIAALLILAVLVVHAFVPMLRVIALTDPYLFELLSGADPLITGYLDAGLVPTLLLTLSSCLLLWAFVATLRGGSAAPKLIIFTTLSSAASLLMAQMFGITSLMIGPAVVISLAVVMIMLFMVVRQVTKKT